MRTAGAPAARGLGAVICFADQIHAARDVTKVSASALATFQSYFLQLLPNPLLTPDQVELLKRDNVVSDEAVREGRTLAGLGIEPTAIEAIAPSYLWRFRKSGQFKVTDSRT